MKRRTALSDGPRRVLIFRLEVGGGIIFINLGCIITPPITLKISNEFMK